MKKTLYIMRHGQTLFNVRRKIQGWCDAPLTDIGIKQAKCAAKYFKDHHINFDHAYSSTSERACDTLEIVTENKIPYTRLKGLKERNFGTFEGESEDLNPQLPYGDFFKPYGGENDEEVQKRMVDTITHLMEQEDHENVLIVSHGASIGAFAKTLNMDKFMNEIKKFTNCSILKFEYENHHFELVGVINHDLTHL